tara:strand:- start:407 stop:1672 length:1266 start_codon:yes stop_codon:yes gene_type:complete
MKNNFQQIVKLVKNNKLKEALTLINNIANHHKDFNLVNLKGFIYFNLKEFQKSYQSYSIAIKIKDSSFMCYSSRGTASFELGNFSDAIKDFKKALSLNNKFFETYENIGKCYSNLGENLSAIKYYKLALDLDPNNSKLIEIITEKLTETDNNNNNTNKIFETDLAIKNLEYNSIIDNKIDDSDIINLISKANKIIDENFNNLNFTQTQIFRRNNLNLNCDRHFSIFKNFKIIPEFCFSCIKVTINLENVIDLIKLFIVFDNILLPNNNLRKCMIDLRSNSKSNYKGFIYCRSIKESEIVKSKLDEIIKSSISKDLSSKIKRGCSEFNNKYPGYENIEKNYVKYDPNWKKYEQIIDSKFPKFNLMKKDQKSKKGISFNDIMIIRNWLFFASLTKDDTFKKFKQSYNVNPNLKKIIEMNKLAR